MNEEKQLILAGIIGGYVGAVLGFAAALFVGFWNIDAKPKEKRWRY